MAREWPATLSCLQDLKHRPPRLHPGLSLWIETVAYLSLCNLQRPLPLPFVLWVSRHSLRYRRAEDGHPIFFSVVCVFVSTCLHTGGCAFRDPRLMVISTHYFITFICLFGRVCGSVTMQVWRSENNLQEVGSLLPLCFWGWGSVYKSWLATGALAEPSGWSSTFVFFFFFF